MTDNMPGRGHMRSDYANLLLFRLLEVLYDSKGKGARFRTCILGKEDLLKAFTQEGLQLIDGDWEANLASCRSFLRDMGIASDLRCTIEDRTLDTEVDTCIHYPVEEMLLKEEVPPYTCIPANLLSLALERGLGNQVEIAKIECGQPTCRIKMLLFEDED